jgi:hypothetical protein
MNEQDRLFVFVTAASLGTANALMKSIDRSPDWAGEKTFGSVKLSPDGSEPTTHYACNSASDFEYRSALFGTSHAPWMTIYSESEGWTWGTAFDDMDLKVIHEDIS